MTYKTKTICFILEGIKISKHCYTLDIAASSISGSLVCPILQSIICHWILKVLNLLCNPSVDPWCAPFLGHPSLDPGPMCA